VRKTGNPLERISGRANIPKGAGFAVASLLSHISLDRLSCDILKLPAAPSRSARHPFHIPLAATCSLAR